MDEVIDTLIVDVRANTQGFKTDVEAMRGTFDSSLVDGFSRAGNVLERGLLSAIRRGSLGFDDLQRVAMRTINEIAAQAVQSGIGSLFGGGNGGNGGVGGVLSAAVGALFGLPGRATGGPVSPGNGYIVGERGPELFVPTSAGRVEQSVPTGGGRDVRVSINLAAPKGMQSPVALQRSARQVASSISRALREF